MKFTRILVIPSNVLSTRKITNKENSIMKKHNNSMFLTFINRLRDLTTINSKILTLRSFRRVDKINLSSHSEMTKITLKNWATTKSMKANMNKVADNNSNHIKEMSRWVIWKEKHWILEMSKNSSTSKRSKGIMHKIKRIFNKLHLEKGNILSMISSRI